MGSTHIATHGGFSENVPAPRPYLIERRGGYVAECNGTSLLCTVTGVRSQLEPGVWNLKSSRWSQGCSPAVTTM